MLVCIVRQFYKLNDGMNEADLNLTPAPTPNPEGSSPFVFGDKAAALSSLRKLADECAKENWDGNGAEPINSMALSNAENFLRVLPVNFPIPEFAVEPDGHVSLDWIRSRHCLFSLSVGNNHRLAFAWLDDTDQGHGVVRFDGRQVSNRILEGIAAVVNYGNASVRAA
jgi:hypothetical protein